MPEPRPPSERTPGGVTPPGAKAPNTKDPAATRAPGLSSGRPAPPVRPEFETRLAAEDVFGAVERPLSAWERIGNITAVRRAAILIALALAWEI